jgi:hypothetical protein
VKVELAKSPSLDPSGKVEPKHRNAFSGQRGRDALGRQHILAAGEAMRKQRIGANRPVRQIQRGGERMPPSPVN